MPGIHERDVRGIPFDAAHRLCLAVEMNSVRTWDRVRREMTPAARMLATEAAASAVIRTGDDALARRVARWMCRAVYHPSTGPQT